MITILLFCGLVSVVYFMFKNSDFDQIFNCAAASFLYIVFSGFFIFLLGTSFVTEKNRINHEMPIYSLRNAENVSGSFFLGSGRIGGQEYYYTFVKDARDGFFREKLPIHDCYVFQDSNENPRMFWQTVYYVAPKWVSIWPKITQKRETKIDLHVPKNTIIEEFKIQ